MALSVKPRYDGLGDAWALEHRTGLGSGYYFTDLDAVFGQVAFGHNTGDILFLEYVPDDYKNRASAVRRFGVVALFDRKASAEYAFSPRNALPMAFYCWLCRTLAQSQPHAPLFFIVEGGQEPPWTLHQVDIATGKPTGLTKQVTGTQEPGGWKPAWESLGLGQLRRDTELWLKGQP